MAILRAALPPVRPDGRAAIIRFIADLTAAKKFNAERPSPSWRIIRGLTLPALHDAVMIMLVKDEADIIGQSLRHHHQLGFRRFCILDNNSTDATAAIIAKFRDTTPDTTVLYVQDPVPGYYQSAKMNAAQKLCEAYMPITGAPPGWFFFIDADEFITFAGTGDLAADARNLNAALSNSDANLLIMHWVHSAPASLHESLAPDADMFAANPVYCPQLAPRVPKVAYRAGSNLDLMMGNHFVSEHPYNIDNVIVGAAHSLFMFHFSLRSLAHVKRKIINGGLAYRQAQGLDDHGGHWRKRYELYQQHGEAVVANILFRHIRETRERK
jgi:hypothetical protein